MLTKQKSLTQSLEKFNEKFGLFGDGESKLLEVKV
jgi:hypothetical protein